MSDAEFTPDAEGLKRALQNAYERGADIGGYSMLVGVRRLIDLGEDLGSIRTALTEMVDAEFPNLDPTIKASIDSIALQELN